MMRASHNLGCPSLHMKVDWLPRKDVISDIESCLEVGCLPGENQDENNNVMSFRRDRAMCHFCVLYKVLQ
jgi:hypothetical protein